ncbi:MAG: glycerol-3-phosphate 1-O-acyltransferase PlsY [Clostridia bacterium]|nr:glycerol-3-phosphate 1-O-acyltransferase PlsY [Clostridia bacterium]
MLNPVAVLKFVVACLAAYFLGNVNPAILVSRAIGGRDGDIRKQGSGNPGTTNMLRVYGKKAAGLTLLIDVLKGVVAVLIGKALGGAGLGYLCGFLVEIGHMWPVCWGFKGGKGIATGLGVILAISPVYGLLELAVAVCFFAATKMVSPGSLAAAVALPILAHFFAPGFFWYALALGIIVIYKHRANIGKLMRGEESKISFKK